MAAYPGQGYPGAAGQAPGAPPGGCHPGGPYGGAAPGGPYGPPTGPGPYGHPPPPAGAPGGPYGGGPAPGGPYGQPGTNPYGVPPAGPYGGAAPGGSAPPGVDQEAFSWFQAVDTDRSGYISLKELKAALVNSNWSAFNNDTCMLMLNMFDKTGSGRMDVYGFSALLRFIQQWRNLFQQYDRDQSGSISFSELQQALSQMGYNLSPQFSQLLLSRYTQRSSNPSIQLDRFIHICIQLQSMTEAFREKDTGLVGNVRLGYEDFLAMVVTRML